MRQEKDTQRSTVSVGFDGRVYKQFRGPKAEERFATEVKVLKYLEARECPFVPRLLDSEADQLKIVTSNCGAIVQQLSDGKVKYLFEELEGYGVRHDDPFARNITYRASDGRFCVIDFEFATILEEAGDEVVASTEVEDEGEGDEVTDGGVLSWTCRTDVGRYRKNNEDAYLALSVVSEGVRFLGREGTAPLRHTDLIFAVSDGMGGARSGEFASRIAIDKITQLLPGHFRRDAGGPSGDLDVLTDLFRVTHIEIEMLGDAYPECEGMGATLSMCWFTPERVLIAHVGDSRIYRWREDEGLEQLTKDDTMVAGLQRTGQISEYEARNHPARNMLNKALGGANQFVDPQLYEIGWREGDRFLICSDGVTDGLWDSAVARVLEEGDSADEVVDRAVDVSGRDNATAVIVTAGDRQYGLRHGEG